MVFFGIVSVIDHGKGLVKVDRQDIGTSSEWLQVLQGNTVGNKSYSMPKLGENGLCVCPDNGKEGYYIKSGYNEIDTPPSFHGEGKNGIEYSDGTTIYYDEKSSTLYLDVKNSINIVCPQISITGNIDIKGTVTVSEDVIASGVSLVKHQNTGVTPGGALTGPPAK